MDPVSVGKRIAKLRKEKGLTQKQLADALGISNKTVSKWETGDGYPDITMIHKLAETFGVTTDYFFSQEEITTENTELSGHDNIARKFYYVSGITIVVMMLHCILWFLLYMFYRAGHASEPVAIVLSYAGIGIMIVGPVVAGLSAIAVAVIAFIDKNKKLIAKSICLILIAVMLKIILPLLMTFMAVAF